MTAKRQIVFEYHASQTAESFDRWDFYAVPDENSHAYLGVRIESFGDYPNKALAERAARRCLHRMGLRARKMKDDPPRSPLGKGGRKIRNL